MLPNSEGKRVPRVTFRTRRDGNAVRHTLTGLGADLLAQRQVSQLMGV